MVNFGSFRLYFFPHINPYNNAKVNIEPLIYRAWATCPQMWLVKSFTEIHFSLQSLNISKQLYNILQKDPLPTFLRGRYFQYTVPDTVSVETTFVAMASRAIFSAKSRNNLTSFSLQLPTIPFEIVACSFFRQPFSKWLYIY